MLPLFLSFDMSSLIFQLKNLKCLPPEIIINFDQVNTGFLVAVSYHDSDSENFFNCRDLPKNCKYVQKLCKKPNCEEEERQADKKFGLVFPLFCSLLLYKGGIKRFILVCENLHLLTLS